MKKIIQFLACIFIAQISLAQIKYTVTKELIPIQLERISMPIKDLQTEKKINPNGRTVRENEMEEHEHAPNFKEEYTAIGKDAATQKLYSDTSETVLTILNNLEGLEASVDPSDNTLAAGPNHVMQMVNNWDNSIIRIWDKLGNIIVDEVNTNDVTGFSDYGDPNLIYDEQADRWAFVLLAYSGSKLILGISQTNDPTGAYYGYSFSPGFGFPDYPKIAVWNDSYLITTNSNDPAIFALNRTELLNGEPFGTIQKWTLDDFGSIGFQAPSPVQQTGSLPPSEDAPALIMRIADEAWSGVDSDYLEMVELHVDWVDMDASFISDAIIFDITPYDSYLCGFGSWDCIPQPGSPKKLDPLADILMDKVQYRNFGDHETIVCSTVSNADGEGTAGVRWFELRKNPGGDWYIFQQSTYQPDEHHRWMSSITINQFGTIALAYNISSGTVYPGIRMTGRTYCDSLNVMTAVEMNAQDGAGANSNNRYGDYNALVTDPVDGTFWFTANYNPSSSWKTRVIHFALDTCGYIPSDTIGGPDTTSQDTTIVDSTQFMIDYLFQDLNVSPIPAQDQLHIVFQSAQFSDAELQVLDINGKLILQKQIKITAGKNAFKIATESFPNGNYLLKLWIKNASLTRQFIIQHE